jgi:hypothetical protein
LGLGKVVNEAIEPAKSTMIPQKMITELAHRVTYEPFETGEASTKLTGEMIIYLDMRRRTTTSAAAPMTLALSSSYGRMMEHALLRAGHWRCMLLVQSIRIGFWGWAGHRLPCKHHPFHL